jgi:hypothetical protein
MAEQGATDVAALAASTMAVSVSMLVADGPFTAVGAIIALSVLLVLISYVGTHPRQHFQSTAMGAVIGVLCMPVGGFILEILHGQTTDVKVSSVSQTSLFLIWITTGAVATLFDYCRQQPR